MTEQLLGSRYRLVELIAQGGMGEVWRAQDEVLERPVAVKLLHDALSDDGPAAERFRREALTAASLSHPNMANVYDYVEEGGRPGIVMELLDCETLAQRLARGPLPAAEAVGIAEAVLGALAEAHDAGVVHRDIKPGNILLTRDGRVKVADFGIARTAGDAQLTMTGTIMGTAHYTAPEQVRGGQASPTTDIYALGCVLYEMLTGRRCFEGDTPFAVAMARLTNDPAPPSTVLAGIPRSLERVVMRALEREPKDRFASASEMRAALVSAAPERDETSVLPIGGPWDETVALRATHRDAAPQVKRRHRRKRSQRPAPDVIPPPWAAKRIARALLPLLAVAAITLLLFSAFAGPGTVAVPKFTGMTVADARILAQEHGITLKFKTVDSAQPRNTVLRQDIAAGREIAASDATVTLTLSSGTPPCCTVPNLIGLTPSQAKQALEDADLRLGVTYRQPTTEGEDGKVIKQLATGRLDPETAVDIIVADHPPPEDDDRDGKGKRGRGGDGDN